MKIMVTGTVLKVETNVTLLLMCSRQGHPHGRLVDNRKG